MPNLKRLYHTLQTLENLPKEKNKKFYLGSWSEKEPWCGTTCCAFGAEAMTKEANDAGLKLVPEYSSFVPIYRNKAGRAFTNFAAAAAYYDITLKEADYLFDPSSYRAQDNTRRTTVMKRIEKFICDKSKEMKEQNAKS